MVEMLDGADNLAEVVRAFGPRPGRRLGILLDHLVDDSKESRLAAEVDHPDVLVTGHPYVDVWAAVKPSVVGLARLARRAQGRELEGRRLPRASASTRSPRRSGSSCSARSRSYADLEPPLVGAVEQLIDFVTTPRSPLPPVAF